jgi:hypothetical protein
MANSAKPEKTEATTIRLTAGAREALDKHAAQQEGGARTRSWLIQKIVTDWLNARVKPRKAKATK